MRKPAWLLLLLCGVLQQPASGQPPKPPTPSAEAPALVERNVTIACLDCDRPFGGDGHRKAFNGLLANSYTTKLRHALFYQDSVHQFESRAHFDNCDFDAATAYVESLLGEADGHVKSAQAARARNDAQAVESLALKAFFSVGQALHAVQDFYAHTNYVELTKDQLKDAADIEVVPFWTPAGKEKLQRLRQSGLISGFVFWGVPQRCPAGTMSHADLAKDGETTTSGKVRVAHLENISQYRLALVAARTASVQFLQHCFKRWPLLQELNGRYTAFEVMVDRRGL